MNLASPSMAWAILLKGAFCSYHISLEIFTALYFCGKYIKIYIYIYTHNPANGEGQHGVVIKSTDSEASPPWLDSGSVASSSVISGTPFNPVTQFPPVQNKGGDSKPCLIQL